METSETVSVTMAGSRPLRSLLESSDTFVTVGVVNDAPLNFRETDFTRESEKKSSFADIARTDIMTQSLRRQTRKNSKPTLADIVHGAAEFNSSIAVRGPSPDKFMMFNPGDAQFKLADVSQRSQENRRSKRSLPYNKLSSHEDVQVLNLQGFMDGSGGRMSPNNVESKKKSKRRRSKRLDDGTPGNLSHQSSRRKRHSLSRGRGVNEDDIDDVALRDLDELDYEMSGLVLGAKVQTNDPVGVPISLEEASELRKLLTGNPVAPLPQEWMTQNFQLNSKPNLSYGLVQKKVNCLIVLY